MKLLRKFNEFAKGSAVCDGLIFSKQASYLRFQQWL